MGIAIANRKNRCDFGALSISRGRVNRRVQTVNWETGKEGGCRDKCQERPFYLAGQDTQLSPEGPVRVLVAEPSVMRCRFPWNSFGNTPRISYRGQKGHINIWNINFLCRHSPPVCPRDKPGLSQGQTGLPLCKIRRKPRFVPGTTWVCPWDELGLSQGQTGARPKSNRTKTFMFMCLFLAWS